jgi:hypothetical protein
MKLIALSAQYWSRYSNWAHPNYMCRVLTAKPTTCYLSFLLFCGFNGQTISDCWIGKDVEGNGHDLIKVLSQHVPWETGKTTKNRSQDSWCPSWDSNRAPLKQKSTALPLYQPILLLCVMYRNCLGNTTIDGHSHVLIFQRSYILSG